MSLIARHEKHVSFLPCRYMIHIYCTSQQGLYLNVYHCLSKDVSLKALHDCLVECVSSCLLMCVVINIIDIKALPSYIQYSGS